MAISEITGVRVPPQNLEAEQSVLGAILLDNAALNRAMEIVSGEDFYRTANQMVYRSSMLRNIDDLKRCAELPRQVGSVA